MSSWSFVSHAIGAVLIASLGLSAVAQEGSPPATPFSEANQQPAGDPPRPPEDPNFVPPPVIEPSDPEVVVALVKRQNQLQLEREELSILREAWQTAARDAIATSNLNQREAKETAETLRKQYVLAMAEFEVQQRELNVLMLPGDRIQVEILEALPGRPVTGIRTIGPDGRVSLDFYGEVFLAGMTTAQAKVRVIEHMRRFIPDETLGLVDFNPRKNEYYRVKAEDSDRVHVTKVSEPYHPVVRSFVPGARDDSLGGISETLHLILRELRSASPAVSKPKDSTK